MSRGRILVASAALGIGACTFDPSGPSAAGADAGDGIALRDGAPAAIDAPAPDAAPPDADLLVCRDRDGDGFFAGTLECGPTDCDDLDARAHPGQVEAFTEPTAAGSFDFDCDGRATPLAEDEGFECQWDWGECVGSGWLDGVPECGDVGQWHWCRTDGWECYEDGAFDAAMPCR